MQQLAPPPPPPPPPAPISSDTPKPLSPAELERLSLAISSPILPPTSSSLPPEVSIVPVTPAHIPSLQRINSLLLPVPYAPSFYKGILDPLSSGLFSRAILWTDPARPQAEAKVIGGLVCRFETNPFVDEEGRSRSTEEIRKLPYPSWKSPNHAVYIQSLGVLSPYRSLGLAAAALDHIVASAVALREAGPRYDANPNLPMINVHVVYAHVWTDNEEGLKWYDRRGFVKFAEPFLGYYQRLTPDSAWIVRKEM